ncbi:MAG: methylated-DNA--[protein]-cysteine S-methyltransferase [Bryobacterales bacterium]|nr:methylated-DNA--[protein]-cysteine S-methyltransferase [Bryobacterales bacterium]
MVIWTEIEPAPGWRLRLAASDESLRLVNFVRAGSAAETELAQHFGTEVLRQQADAEIFRQAASQLERYFRGDLRQFALPLALRGTPFQLRVWALLQTIPYGETCSYRELAGMAGIPKGSRAVGLANGANPVAIIVPCHRVIASNGKLQGYAGGLAAKKMLLDIEAGRFTLAGL